jgi:signal transduction histidine kinase
VLVVDDSPVTVEIFRIALCDDGWDVRTSLTADAAFELVHTWRPDVVVCDLYMPEMDGLAFFRRLRTLDALLPLIMVSGEESLSVVLSAVHEGVYDYVQKNGDTRALCAAVTRAAHHVEAVRENARLSDELKRANQELESRVAERTAQLSAANQELQRLMGQLVSSERLAAIGQLAAGIAHEINNPLSYVMSNMTYARHRLVEIEQALTDLPAAQELLHGKRRPTGGRTVLQEMQQALIEAEDGATRITDIVRDVRTMSRTDDRARSRFDLNAAIRSATRIAGEQIRRRAILKLDLTPNLEVMGSAGRMTQVLLNLLVNAAQAVEEMPGREHEINVSSRRVGDKIVVEVRDSGPGIQPEHRQQLFNPFFTTKPEGRGTGLGLSISQDIVHRHGGAIEVASAPGAGTTFTIELPAALGPASRMESFKVL